MENLFGYLQKVYYLDGNLSISLKWDLEAWRVLKVLQPSMLGVKKTVLWIDLEYGLWPCGFSRLDSKLMLCNVKVEFKP